jgi:glutathione S-transferase
MTDSRRTVVFHEYALSPFSEKIRRVFGYKKIAYHSVEQPMWMPKPHLTPLTGGYRRIPVMQVGADVYCDTALIVRKLDTMYPDAPVVPADLAGAVHATEQWADKQLFAACVPLVFTTLAALLPSELIEDRKKMRPDLDIKTLEKGVPYFLSVVSVACARIDATLAKSKFVLGERFTAADAAIYHCLWFARNAEPGAKLLAKFPAVSAWMQRLGTFGVGDLATMSPNDALALAERSEPNDLPKSTSNDPDPTGFKVGEAVAVCADDLPQDVFRGTVVAITPEELVIERKTDDLGRLWQHFPRVGYLIQRG